MDKKKLKAKIINLLMNCTGLVTEYGLFSVFDQHSSEEVDDVLDELIGEGLVEYRYNEKKAGYKYNTNNTFERIKNIDNKPKEPREGIEERYRQRQSVLQTRLARIKSIEHWKGIKKNKTIEQLNTQVKKWK